MNNKRLTDEYLEELQGILGTKTAISYNKHYIYDPFTPTQYGADDEVTLLDQVSDDVERHASEIGLKLLDSAELHPSSHGKIADVMDFMTRDTLLRIQNNYGNEFEDIQGNEHNVFADEVKDIAESGKYHHRKSFGMEEPRRPQNKAEELGEALYEPFRQMQDEELAQIPTRGEDFIKGNRIIDKFSKELYGSALKSIKGRQMGAKALRERLGKIRVAERPPPKIKQQTWEQLNVSDAYGKTISMSPSKFLQNASGGGAKKIQHDLEDAHSNPYLESIPYKVEERDYAAKKPFGSERKYKDPMTTDTNYNVRGDELGGVEYYKRKIRQGDPIQPPDFSLSSDTLKIIAHEGRHRARAFKEEGVKKIPVGLIAWSGATANEYGIGLKNRTRFNLKGIKSQSNNQKGEKDTRYPILGRISKTKLKILQAKITNMQKIKDAGVHSVINSDGEFLESEGDDHFELTRKHLGLVPDAQGNRPEISDDQVHQMLKDNNFIRVQNFTKSRNPHLSIHLAKPANALQMRAIKRLFEDHQLDVGYFMGDTIDSAIYGTAFSFNDFRLKYTEAFRGKPMTARLTPDIIRDAATSLTADGTYSIDNRKVLTNEELLSIYGETGKDFHIISSTNNNQGDEKAKIKILENESSNETLDNKRAFIGRWGDFLDYSYPLNTNDSRIVIEHLQANPLSPQEKAFTIKIDGRIGLTDNQGFFEQIPSNTT